MNNERDLTVFKKAIYWHDWADKEDEQSDLKIQVLNPCEEAKILLKKINCFDLPQCLFEEDYEILFFDWGGMCIGNSLMESFCREIYKHAEDHPNRFYVMVSSFTASAMKDAISEFGKDKPFNIFLSIEELGWWLDKNHE